MEKMKMHTPNLTQENIARIRELFPNCVTEAPDEGGQIRLAVDFDQLRQELSESIVEGPQERYHLNWPGKRKALLAANAPIAKTLRPCREESVDFDTTKNLFIEGDNLDALKLLQETYLGKIKMIYIDPPYNTGNDFIYKDNFAENKEEFLKKSNQRDEEGNRLVANTESNGRFHSDWLSMMYPRLKLARNLLRDDGQIFISIGDNEIHNLKSLCDEIFGADNFEGHIHWRRRHNQPNDPTKMIGLVAEHILSYSKNKWLFKTVGVGKIELTGDFSNPDNDPRGDWASKPWKVGSDQSGSKYSITTPTGTTIEGEWMGDEVTYKRLLLDNRIIFPNNGKGYPRKKYFQFERESEGQCATNWWPHDQFGHNQEGNDILTELMDGIKNTFSNPKPPRLIRNLILISNCKPGDIILDFFLGSASTFHSAFDYDNSLRVIGVQIPEILNESIKEHLPAIEFCRKNNLKLTIAEIAKERIRRAGKKIREEITTKHTKDTKNDNQLNLGEADQGVFRDSEDLDIGFRVLKIDSSNMADVYYKPDDIKQGELELFTDNIKPDRTPEDLLFQVLLDWGVDLSLPIRKERIIINHERHERHEKNNPEESFRDFRVFRGSETKFEVFFVDKDALIACFDEGIDEDLVKELAQNKPLRVVFRDTGFVSDAVKINAEQIFKQMSPGTEVRSI